jgi:hypothetical protein
MHMVMFVLDDPDLLDKVLDAWEAIDVSGVTIIESTGINRRAQARLVGAPFMAGINRMMGSTMEGHYTLFTIVKGPQMVEACIRAAESVVGDFNEPNSGVLAAWPLTYVKGVPDDGKKRRA